MPAAGALEVGRPIVLSTTGSNQVVLPRSGQLLGFWLTAAATVTLYDAASVTGIGTPIMPATAAPLGWNFFPVDLVAGLVAQISAGNLVAVVC